MYVRLWLFTSILSLGAVVQAADTPYQVRYATNLNLGESTLVFTNTGASSTSGIDNPNGTLCANVYAFNPAGQMVACTSYTVGANTELEVSVKKGLLKNAATPTSVMISVLATVMGADCVGSAALVGDAGHPLGTGMAVWSSTFHLKQPPAQPVAAPETVIKSGPPQKPPAPPKALTGTAFTSATLSAAELNSLNTACAPLLQ